MKIIRKYIDFLNEGAELIQSNPPIQQIQPTASSKLDKFADMIELTLLKPNVSKENINELINVALQNNFYGICVPPELVDHAVYSIEDNTKLKVISVVDFPKGTNKEHENIDDTNRLISDNVDEIDIVMDYNALKKASIDQDTDVSESSYQQIESELKSVVNECHKNGVIVKIIIEIGALTIEEVTKACNIVANTGADFAMTSTGTIGDGSDINKVKEMRRVLPEHIKIKVAGGIRTLQDCEKFYQYVDRIGTSVILK